MTTCSSTASLFSELKTRIDTRQARIGVMGLGYVGLPLALLYTEAKVRVTGFDIDQHKVATLTSGGIVTDHSDYDYKWIAQHAPLVVDTRNATRGIHGDNIVRC